MKTNMDFIDEYRKAYSAMDERAEEVMKAYGKELDLLAIGRAKVIKEQHLTDEEEIEEALEDWRAENLFYCVYEDRHNNLYTCTINGVRWNKERGCIEAHVVEDNGGYIDDWMPASYVYDQDAVYMSILTYIDGETNENDLVMVFGSSACSAYEDEGIKGLKRALKNGDGDIVLREFDTQAERNAYLEGLEDCNGWEGYTNIPQAVVQKHKKAFAKMLKQ